MTPAMLIAMMAVVVGLDLDQAQNWRTVVALQRRAGSDGLRGQ